MWWKIILRKLDHGTCKFLRQFNFIKNGLSFSLVQQNLRRRIAILLAKRSRIWWRLWRLLQFLWRLRNLWVWGQRLLYERCLINLHYYIFHNPCYSKKTQQQIFKFIFEIHNFMNSNYLSQITLKNIFLFMINSLLKSLSVSLTNFTHVYAWSRH